MARRAVARRAPCCRAGSRRARRRALLGRDLGLELVADRLDDAAVVDALDGHLLVLGSPAPQLALDVAVVAGESAEARRLDVDVVQLREGGRQVVADAPRVGLVEGRLGLGAVAQDRAVDELHHVEGSFVDVLVGAQSERRGDGDAEREQRRDDRDSRTMSCAVGGRG